MTDTEICQVTEPGANIFRELGFEPEEAARLQAKSRQEIDAALALKEQLMGELAAWIRDNHFRQAEAAEVLRVSRPRVSDVVNRKTGKFTIDALVQMLARTGRTVSLKVSFTPPRAP